MLILAKMTTRKVNSGWWVRLLDSHNNTSKPLIIVHVAILLKFSSGKPNAFWNVGYLCRQLLLAWRFSNTFSHHFGWLFHLPLTHTFIFAFIWWCSTFTGTFFSSFKANGVNDRSIEVKKTVDIRKCGAICLQKSLIKNPCCALLILNKSTI